MRKSKLSPKNEVSSARLRAQREGQEISAESRLPGCRRRDFQRNLRCADKSGAPYFIDYGGIACTVEIEGARLSKSKRRALIPVFAEGAVDEDLLQEGRRNIRDYLQSLGYFNAAVQVSSRQDDQRHEQVITYQVARGDHFRLAGVSFTGNKYFSSDLLSRRLMLSRLPLPQAGDSANNYCGVIPTPSAGCIYRTVFKMFRLPPRWMTITGAKKITSSCHSTSSREPNPDR